MIASSGNISSNSRSKFYNHPDGPILQAPARWDGVLAIGASTSGAALNDEQRSSYSCYDTGEDQKLLITAPVDSTPDLRIVTTYSYPDTLYNYKFGGTSASCPIVVGVVALMLSINPSLTYSEISDILANTAEKIGNYSYTPRSLYVGYGRINAYKAVVMTASPKITSPAGSEHWRQNSQHTISFTSSVTSTYQIWLSRDNGQTFPTQIASSVGGSSPHNYNWTIASPPSSNCKILIIDNNNTVLRDTSKVFSIDVITSPTGGEQWCQYTQHSITWTSITSTTYQIKLSTDNGATFPTQIASSVGSPYSYNWTINSSASNNCKILIIDNNDTSIRDTSFTFVVLSNSPATPGNFNVVIYQNKPKLTWTAVPNVAGYNFWRASSEEGYDWGVGPFDWITDPSATSYIDTEVYHNPNNHNPNLMKYKMESFSSCGGVSPQTSEKTVSYERILVKDALSNDIPNEFRLKQNYPNPFNPTTKIVFDLPERTNVKIVIYDQTGRTVRYFYSGVLEAGQREIEWDGKNDLELTVSSGIYFYRLEYTSNNQPRSVTGKMLLMK